MGNNQQTGTEYISLQVLNGKLNYKDLTEEQKSTPIIAHTAYLFDHKNLNFFPETQLRDFEFLKDLFFFNKNIINVRGISQKILEIHQVRCALSLRIHPVEFDENWLSDEDLVVFLLQNNLKYHDYPSKFFSDEILVKKILEKNPEFIKQFKGPEDSSLYHYLIEKHPMMIEFCPLSVRDDADIMMKAIEYSGLLLAYASKRLQSDKDLVLEAVKETSDAMSHVSNEFRSNKMIMMEVVRKQPMTLYYASKELKEDLDVVIPAVEKNYRCLIYLPFEFRNTQPIYLATRKMYQKMIPNSETLKKVTDIHFIYQ
jgi:hypothetical protein